jgi:hypothetical protein
LKDEKAEVVVEAGLRAVVVARKTAEDLLKEMEAVEEDHRDLKPH